MIQSAAGVRHCHYICILRHAIKCHRGRNCHYTCILQHDIKCCGGRHCHYACGILTISYQNIADHFDWRPAISMCVFTIFNSRSYWGWDKMVDISQTTFYKCIFLNENIWIPNTISLKFVPRGRINNMPALVRIMAWRRSGDNLLSEPLMVSLLTHICITWPPPRVNYAVNTGHDKA